MHASILLTVSSPRSKSMGDSERKRIVATMDMRPISEVYENELRSVSEPIYLYAYIYVYQSILDTELASNHRDMHHVS